jgi:hypothetical protein
LVGEKATASIYMENVRSINQTTKIYEGALVQYTVNQSKVSACPQIATGCGK